MGIGEEEVVGDTLWGRSEGLDDGVSGGRRIICGWLGE